MEPPRPCAASFRALCGGFSEFASLRFSEFLVRCLKRSDNIFALGLTLGLVCGAGDIRMNRDGNFRM